MLRALGAAPDEWQGEAGPARTTLAIARGAQIAQGISPSARDGSALKWAHAIVREPHLLGADAEASAHLLAWVYEWLLTAQRSGKRRRLGVHYTPSALVNLIIRTALLPVLSETVARAGRSRANRARALLGVRVLDPACGTGLFLQAAVDAVAHRLVLNAGMARDEAVRRVTRTCVCGIDVDPHAVRVCRALLRLRAGLPVDAPDALDSAVTAGDALVLGPEGVCAMAGGASRGYDAVVANPPFLTQRLRVTGRTGTARARVQAWSGGAVLAQTDSAAAFMLLAARSLRAGGRMSLVQPRATLTAESARAARAAVAQSCTLEFAWASGARVFGASVHVCVLTLRRDEPDAPSPRTTRIGRYQRGRIVAMGEAVDMDELAGRPSWGALAAHPAVARAVPPAMRPAHPRSTLADIAHATADFRDAYYGLKGCVSPWTVGMAGTAHAALITTGLIDLGRSLWHTRTARLHGRAMAQPTVNLRALARTPAMARWARARRVPKVLLATQTRVIEAVVDEGGAWLPCTPVITLTARQDGPLGDLPLGERLWMIAAALCSPLCCERAHREHAGSALHPDAIKLSAKQALQLTTPNPASRRAMAAWRAAAACLRAASETPLPLTASAEDDRHAAYIEALRAYASLIMPAFEMDGSLTKALIAWWLDRLPRPRAANAAGRG